MSTVVFHRVPPPSASSTVSVDHRHSRWWRGLGCWALFLIAPLGWFIRGRFIRRMEPERLDRGLVLILPGIEGRSFLNIAVMQGLLDAAVPYALDIIDWTTGNKLLFLYHLRARKRNEREAQRLAERIVQYRRDYPGRPVWILGHSGGGGMALLVARSLPADVSLTGVILLAAAVSRRFDLQPALDRVERGIWSFYSWGDWLFVGIGTMLFGTIDGPHGPAAGMLGFTSDAAQARAHGKLSHEGQSAPVFVQRGHSAAMIRQFHLGGHFGCVHRVFIAETIGPLLHADITPMQTDACAA